MPEYRSPYDTNPLPNPNGSGESGGSSAGDAALSKNLRLNWKTYQALNIVPLDSDPPGETSGEGGEGGGKGGSEGSGENTAGGELTDHSIRVRPDELLDHEQHLLDRAGDLIAEFNTLVADSEAALDRDFWGQNEGVNQHEFKAAGHQRGPDGDGLTTADPGPHYVYTRSALSTQEFLPQLRMNQRSALQHAADMITVTGGYVAALNQTAEAWANADLASVFPEKSEIPQAAQD